MNLIEQLECAVAALNSEPEYHDQGMGCGLEDRGIFDRYQAMAYGWDEALERVAEHQQGIADAITAAIAALKPETHTSDAKGDDLMQQYEEGVSGCDMDELAEAKLAPGNVTSTDGARQGITNIIYELNVEPDEVDGVVDQIMALLPSPGITIDMAGAMEKITPNMLDEMRDLLIENLTKRCTEMQKALGPFADKVFADNGDITVQDSHKLTTGDFAAAYYAYRGSVPTHKPTSGSKPMVGQNLVSDGTHPHTGDRPANCRERLREEGKAYPRSGCNACALPKFGGSGCPHA